MCQNAGRYTCTCLDVTTWLQVHVAVACKTANPLMAVMAPTRFRFTTVPTLGAYGVFGGIYMVIVQNRALDRFLAQRSGFFLRRMSLSVSELSAPAHVRPCNASKNMIYNAHKKLEHEPPTWARRWYRGLALTTCAACRLVDARMGLLCNG